MEPTQSLAGPDLTPGEDAVVANTDGDGATLRTGPGRESARISTVPEGTPVAIIDGPVPAADGSLWYQVTVNGAGGYISADHVDRSGAEDAPASPTETDADADAGDSAADEASTADSSGSAVQGPAAATIPWQQPVAVGIVVNTTGTLPVDGITCRADAADGAPVITELWEGNALEITGEQVFDGAGGGWYPINCAGVGGFVSAAYVALDAPVVDETVTEEPVTTEVGEEPVTEGIEDTVGETTTEAIEEAATEDIPEETAPVDEVTTDEVTTEEPADDDRATVEDVVTTEPELPAESETTETETETSPKPDSETDNQTEAEVATQTDVESATETTPVEETEVTTETEAEADTTTTSEPGVEPEATDESEGAVSPVAIDPTVEATEDPTEPATDAPPATPATDATPAEPERPEMVDLSRAIGYATVHGTDGSGLTCRAAADTASPTITVLPEGASVAMMAAPSGAWVSIVCGGQLGFGLVIYLDTGDTAPSDFGADDTGRTVAVQGTGGGGLNCRASASLSGRRITLVPEGSSLTIRGVPRDGWLPVVCAGRNGYVPVDYVAVPTGQGGGGEPVFTMTSAGTGTVANTGGGGVRCRTRATTTAGTIITVLGEGTRVTLRGTPSRGWAPVTCAGRNGYVSLDYLKIVAGGASANDGAGPGGNTSGGVTSSSARITGTGSGGLNCRAGAGTQHRVITVLRANTTIVTRGAVTNGWLPVVCGNQNGYVSAQYVMISSTPGSGEPIFESEPTGSATVTGTGGSGVRCRTAPVTGSIITVLREGARVDLRGTPANGWAPVTCGGRSGFVSAAYVRVGTAPAPSPGGSDSGPTTGLRGGDHAKVMRHLNLRDEASYGGGVAISIPAGTVVLIRGAATNGFYPIDWDGFRGHALGEYLAKSNAPLSERGIASGGGSGSTGWPSIWGNGNYRVSQEIGLTEFAKKHVNGMYAYSTAYGIHGHAGIDVSMPTGTPLYTPVSGTVVVAGGTRYYTHAAHGGGVPGSGELRIQLDNGDQLILGHMSRISLAKGQRVTAGQMVGLSGSYNGPHVHVEYRRRGGNTISGFTAVDPRLALGGAMPIITGAGRR